MTSFNSNLSVPDVKREPEMVIMPASAASVSAPASAAAVPNMPLKNERLNGYPDDGGGMDSGAASAWPSNTRNDLQCCLLDNGRRCSRIAGNASYNKRIQKTVAQKKLKLQLDNSVSTTPSVRSVQIPTCLTSRTCASSTSAPWTSF